VGSRKRSGGRTFYGRFETFVRDYTSGMAPEDLRRLVDRDARRVYSVLTRDRVGPAPPERGLKRLLFDARLLFLSLSEKLTPGRRLIFALSLIAAAIGAFGFELTYNSPDHGFQIDASPVAFLVAIAGLLFLLASELVDRVLVRDEVEVARQLQRELLPKGPPEVAGWTFTSSWRTANDIGGDYHCFERLADGRLAILVADASGHGMAAGLLMAIADTTLRIGLEHDPSPPAVAALLHRALRRTGDRRAFVTLFYGLLEPSTGAVEYAAAGHPSPLVRRADGRVEEPVAGSLPLGMVETCRPELGAFRLAPGDRVVLCTDGVFEALDQNGDAFGWERLRQAVAAPSAGAVDLHARLTAALDRHVDDEPVSDDRTLVVFERRAGAG
jgi:hypothetical protein